MRIWVPDLLLAPISIYLLAQIPGYTAVRVDRGTLLSINLFINHNIGQMAN